MEAYLIGECSKPIWPSGIVACMALTPRPNNATLSSDHFFCLVSKFAAFS